jgi:uncharacterized membrane protein HdeD (DUF308 family)
MGKTTLEQLAVVLGVDADTKELKKFESGLNTVKTGLKAVTAAGTVAVGGMFAFAKQAAASSDVLGKTASKMSLSTKELQEYIYASEQAGGSQEKFISSFSNLESKMNEAMMGSGSAIQAFKLMGIELTDTNGVMKDTNDVMLEISNAFSKIEDSGMKSNLAKQLGFDDSMITMLQDGSAALDETRKKAEALGFVKSDQMIKDSATFNDNMNDLTKVFDGLANMVNAEFIPVFSELMAQLRDWYIANKQVIQQRLGVFIENLMKFVRGFITVVKELIIFVDRVAQSFGGWERILKFVGIALGAFALFKVELGIIALISILKDASLAFAAFGNAALLAQLKALAIPIAIGLLIAGIVALVDEIRVFSKTGQSVLAPFFNWVLEKIEWFKSTFPNISTVIGTVFGGIYSIINGVFGVISDIWDTLIGKLTISEFFEKQLGKIQSVFTDIKTAFKDFIKTVFEPFSKLQDKISSGIGSVKSFFGIGNDEQKQSPVAQVANNANVTNTKSNSKTDISIPINISGNADSSTVNELEQMLKNTLNNIASKVF